MFGRFPVEKSHPIRPPPKYIEDGSAIVLFEPFSTLTGSGVHSDRQSTRRRSERSCRSLCSSRVGECRVAKRSCRTMKLKMSHVSPCRGRRREGNNGVVTMSLPTLPSTLFRRSATARKHRPKPHHRWPLRGQSVWSETSVTRSAIPSAPAFLPRNLNGIVCLLFRSTESYCHAAYAGNFFDHGGIARSADRNPVPRVAHDSHFLINLDGGDIARGSRWSAI